MPLLYEPFGRTATGRLQHGLKRFPIVSSCGRVCTGQPPHFGACHASSTRIPPSVEASGSQDLASNAVASSAIGTQFTDESVSMVESRSADEVAVHSLSTGNGASSSTSSGNNGIRPASDFKGAIRVQPSDFEEVCVFEESPDGSVTINCMPLTDAVAGASVGSQGTVGDILNKTHTPDVKAGASISSTTEHAPGSIVTAALLHQQREQAAARQGFPAGPAADVSPAAVDMTSTFDEAADFRRGGVGTGSIDRDDTPEGLADVEATSVAPIADWFKNKDDLTTLFYSVLTGGVVATSVFFFDVSIQYIHDLPDILSQDFGIGGGRAVGLPLPGGENIPFRCVMPVAAGVAVAWLQSMGFSPPLKVLTRAMEGVTDDANKASIPQSYGQVFRKAAASAITLGSGASLGPEAPSVELGANTAAVLAPKSLSKRKQRMLIAAGAAAGVSAAFDAPVSGALFAVEFVLKSSRLGLDRLSTSTVFVATSVSAGTVGFLRAKGQALGIAGAGTHLVGRIPYFSVQPNLLVDVLQFSALGLGCSLAAVMLYEGVRVSEIALRPLPRVLSAPLAGIFCGIIAFWFPQVQYGYVNLEEIFRDSTHMAGPDLLALLLAKVLATSVCVGGGLVGGLFAPSLFLGALVSEDDLGLRLGAEAVYQWP